ncbi:hypothetical protein [Aestuariicoccus sp. MJ-SS9]|uniref:hypothetical protein n=1 Tax=Aestuariicoccus sp. MJ-SS9 TaxID=3079855 RepID=UPI002909A671|nr:hypothetical protein [Aestuariicoccus sp. MJ-SS9]MDU8913613.1 hypothetical protein [Aestuariicoccus sp. MJ-SS9]
MTAQDKDFATLVLPLGVTCPLADLEALLQGALARNEADTCHAEPQQAQTVKVHGADVSVTLRLSDGADERHIRLEIAALDLPRETCQARLAGIVHALAAQLPVTHVIWLDTEVRLPADRFIEALSQELGEPAPVVTPIALRRIRPARRADRARPDAASYTAKLNELLPAVDKARAVSTANADARPDSPTKGHERVLRGALVHVADRAELTEMRSEAGIVPVEARLSTWAVSMTVATVSLPVAAPVMIYNLARGEDMRVASLAMGLAGLFLALDSSGAMASVLSSL